MSGVVESGRRSLLVAGAPVWVLLAVGLVCLGVGFGAGAVVRSPEDAAGLTDAPPVGLLTAEVEVREIVATVSARADVVFTDPVRVDPPVPDGASTAVVTGRVPQVGGSVEAGMVLIEVSGRPVIVLPGAFPAYRSIGAGSSGPDVAQLRKALAGLGYSAGEGDSYDAALSRAVDRLYGDAGYPSPGSQDATAASAVIDASDRLSDARDARAAATKQVSKSNAAVKTAQAQVKTAKSRLAAAKKRLSVAKQAPELGSVVVAVRDAAKEALDEATAAVSQANSDLEQVAASLADADEARDEANSAAKLAKREVARAETALAAAKKAAWTPVPLGELVFVTGLPRRVDEVNVALGQDLSDPISSGLGSSETPAGAVVLTGAEVAVTAQVTGAEAELLKVGGTARLSGGDGTLVDGAITTICEPAVASGSDGDLPDCEVGIGIDFPGQAEREALAGNVLVTFQVGRSAAEAVVVPVAAVSADASGQARVEQVVGDLAIGVPAASQQTRFVSIETGLSAEGYVEVAGSDPELKAGDLVVIGRPAAGENPDTPQATP